MFTGIIEEIGSIKGIERGSRSCSLSLKAEKVLEGTRIGDSIAVNGVCLTVTNLQPEGFIADVMPETMERTSFGILAIGSSVNLERALRLDSRLGGHLVSGHIDGIGKVIALYRDDNAYIYEISVEPQISRYIVEKGSVAVEGVSLTVTDVQADRFSVSVIPHTRMHTNLSGKNIGSVVNVECDIIGKYVEKMMLPNGDTVKSGRITLSFLAENGF